ncbi:Regenerating islet-derived protein 3-beta, partial [Lemmus lemmus]
TFLFTPLLYLSYSTLGKDSPKEVPSPRISCPQGSRAYGSYCYALFQIPQTWFDAELACQKRPSGHLVSVLTGAESSFLSSLVRSTGNSYSYVWIGLHDPTLGEQPNGGGWEWSNNDVMNYLNWDGNPSSVVNRGQCGSLTATSGFLKWGDNHCDGKLPFVCKFKEEEGSFLSLS